FNILCAASLILSVAMAGLWGRSYRYEDFLSHNVAAVSDLTLTVYSLRSQDGSVLLMRQKWVAKKDERIVAMLAGNDRYCVPMREGDLYEFLHNYSYQFIGFGSLSENRSSR